MYIMPPHERATAPQGCCFGLIVVSYQNRQCHLRVAVDCLGVLATVVVVNHHAVSLKGKLADSAVSDSVMARLVVVLHSIMEYAVPDFNCSF